MIPSFSALWNSVNLICGVRLPGSRVDAGQSEAALGVVAIDQDVLGIVLSRQFNDVLFAMGG
jgi:hypothetical protein